MSSTYNMPLSLHVARRDASKRRFSRSLAKSATAFFLTRDWTLPSISPHSHLYVQQWLTSPPSSRLLPSTYPHGPPPLLAFVSDISCRLFGRGRLCLPTRRNHGTARRPNVPPSFVSHVAVDSCCRRTTTGPFDFGWFCRTSSGDPGLVVRWQVFCSVHYWCWYFHRERCA